MPALHSANITAGVLQELCDGSSIGPVLMGLEKPVQIVPMNSTVSQILNMAALAAADILDGK
jgi:malate dehydrogenase (oxaloacetate-decarboxylating)(NADP+)